MSRAVFSQAQSARLADEVELLEMLGDAKQSQPFAILRTFSRDDEEIHSGDEAKEWAKAQFAVSQAQRRDLALARRDALELVLQIRGYMYLSGANEPGAGSPLTLNLLSKAHMQLLEAELALSNTPADRLAACEKDWAWRLLVEAITRAMHRVGRSSASACARSRFDRLGAEIRLLEAEAAMKDK